VASKFGPLRLSWYAIVPIALASAAIAVPWLMAHAPEFGFALQRGFALVCHQQPERSFLLFGGSVAVCSRCLGIYLGAAAGLLVRVSRNVAWRGLIVTVTINTIDWVVELAGLHGNWTFARFALGIALGMAAAMTVSAANRESPAATALFRSAPVQRARI
jgi:uncharacterized membrane protein